MPRIAPEAKTSKTRRRAHPLRPRFRDPPGQAGIARGPIQSSVSRHQHGDIVEVAMKTV